MRMTEGQMTVKEDRAVVLNALYPPGAPVRYWPGRREGEGRLSKIRSVWWVLSHGEIVVKVEGYAGGIAESHVEMVEK